MSNDIHRKGMLIILSAPSGSGKTTVSQRVMTHVPGLERSISHTTRAPRAGEVQYKDYHFVTRAEFEALAADGGFIEWAEVHGNLYGTAYSNIDRVTSKSKDLLLVIDVQGAAHIREKKLDAVHIFLLPPSIKELDRRLRSRGLDSPETIDKRLAIAQSEIARWSEYDYAVVNDDLDIAVEDVRSIILAERHRVTRVKRRLEDFLLP